jgi:hypothetical protein
MKTMLTAPIVLLAMALAGCGASHTETQVGPLPNGVTIKLLYPNGPPSASSSSKADSEVGYLYTWSLGDFKVAVEKETLKFDGRDYGPLKAGDSVVIDLRRELRVTVNGQANAPFAK